MHGDKPVTAQQEVPCRVLSPHEAQSLYRHDLPPLQAHILMPPLDAVRRALDRGRAVGGGHVTLRANMQGQFVLSADGDLVQVETEYRDLKHPRLSE